MMQQMQSSLDALSPSFALSLPPSSALRSASGSETLAEADSENAVAEECAEKYGPPVKSSSHEVDLPVSLAWPGE